MSEKPLEKKDGVVVRFAGDSGDGMQLVGSRFTDETAVAGNDLATLPDFPAEIRAPAGTPHGVSAFQIHFASRDILTPGDHPNVLVAMNPAALRPNIKALEKGGTAIGNEDAFIERNLEKAVKPAPAEPGTCRNVSGAQSLASGLVAASVKSGLPLYYASYPITPASELLHELSKHKNFGVRTLQAEDEIAAAGAALGAAFGGSLGVTGTSGPGMDLKSETVGLAVMLELPMIVVDGMRAGPSTGLPTKTEQSDLLTAMVGRHGESPVPIVAAYTPGNCLEAAIEAARIAVKYRAPVILLPDTVLANSSEPWQLPAVDAMPPIDPQISS